MPRADRKESLQRAPQCTPSGHIPGCKCFKNGAGGLLTMGFTKQKTAGPASAPEPGRPSGAAPALKPHSLAAKDEGARFLSQMEEEKLVQKLGWMDLSRPVGWVDQGTSFALSGTEEPYHITEAAPLQLDVMGEGAVGFPVHTPIYATVDGRLFGSSKYELARLAEQESSYVLKDLTGVDAMQVDIQEGRKPALPAGLETATFYSASSRKRRDRPDAQDADAEPPLCGFYDLGTRAAASKKPRKEKESHLQKRTPLVKRAAIIWCTIVFYEGNIAKLTSGPTFEGTVQRTTAAHWMSTTTDKGKNFIKFWLPLVSKMKWEDVKMALPGAISNKLAPIILTGNALVKHDEVIPYAKLADFHAAVEQSTDKRAVLTPFTGRGLGQETTGVGSGARRASLARNDSERFASVNLSTVNAPRKGGKAAQKVKVSHSCFLIFPPFFFSDSGGLTSTRSQRRTRARLSRAPGGGAAR
eukprot:COSAG04_NODE_13_length_42806_cov_92.030323_14_plen_470_part_00